MAPTNQPSQQAPKQSQKPGESVDPTTQPLTVSIQLETTADQLNTILGGLSGFIPPDVASLTVDISVQGVSSRAGE